MLAIVPLCPRLGPIQTNWLEPRREPARSNTGFFGVLAALMESRFRCGTAYLLAVSAT